ncbi:HIRA-interacting protein 3 isoform X1 [Mustela lutreola]|uniref:HIRA-interacting protein 3 isoform X1 n=1 Tax=Mustela lutreola TaxID=9666 RepID=UPI002797A811|nr:HIRA-interacting protein 3 isoform X1 [Mustela lutreola]
MAREHEMRAFLRGFFRGRPDLSALTHSVVRRGFLAHAGRAHLEPAEKQALKRLVEQELLQAQVDEAGAGEERPDLAEEAKGPPAPSRGRGRKRFRFSSESEPSSAASSPDRSGPSAQNGMAAHVRPAEDERPKRASTKATEESGDEQEPQRAPAAQAALEKAAARESGEDEEGGSAGTREVSPDDGGEEEEEEEEEAGASPGAIRKGAVTTSKRAPGTTSAAGEQARDPEDSEEEPVQTRKKAEGKKVARSHRAREEASEDEAPLARKTDSSEEEEGHWKAGARGSGGGRSPWEERSSKQKSRTAGLPGHSEDRQGPKETAAAGRGDDSGGDVEPRVQSKRKDRASRKRGKRQRGGGEDGADGRRKLQPAPEGAGTTAKAGSIRGEASDSGSEVSPSEAEGSPERERENPSFRKGSRKGRTRSSSSSSTDGSPEPKGRKAGSGRRGEDHPAVMRLKRYIRACGAHRNYKKLLGPCRSHKERLSVLRAELEALGMKGNPSLEKCRALKEQREEAAEVASLDVTNIISGSGRPRRRTAWNPSREADTPGELYCRTLGSEDEQPRAPPPDWSHMRGIISSDGESN